MPQNRKRVKRDIFASPHDFRQLHQDYAEEQKGEEPAKHSDLHGSLGYVPADGGPNQIGNMEDGPVLPDNAQAQAEGSAFSEAEPHMQ